MTNALPRAGRFLLLLALCGCVLASGHPKVYYLTKTPYSFSDSTADSVTVHLADWVQVQLNASILFARSFRHETAGCLRIAKHDGRSYWVDSVITPRIRDASPMTIAFTCPEGTGAFHTHPYSDPQHWECTVSSTDTSPGNATTVFEIMVCGFGVDSVTAYRVRSRPYVAFDPNRFRPDATEVARRGLRIAAHMELAGERQEIGR